MKHAGKTAVATDTASDIGRAFAELFAREGAHAAAHLMKSVSGASARLWAAFVAMQEKRAHDFAMPCLAQLSRDELRELGYTPPEISEIVTHRDETPPYWV